MLLQNLLKRGGACFRHRMILFSRTTAHSDGSYDMSILFVRNPTDEDHDLAVIRAAAMILPHLQV
jgi:hypothetical protein